jgi:predicted permease
VIWLRDLLQDFHHSLRQFRRDPSVILVVVLTLALGIGVNTTVYSLVNGVSRPLPVPQPEQIVVLATQIEGDETGFQTRFSHLAIQDLRRETGAFSDVFGFRIDLRGVNTGGRSYQFFVCTITGNYFTALGLKPEAGRLFEPGEGEVAGAPDIVVLGYSFWQKHFGGDRSVVGRQIRIDGRATTVIGIAPQEFHGTFTGADMDGYMPISSHSHEEWGREVFSNRSFRNFTVLARMQPGMTLSRAQTAMDIAALRIQREHPESEKGVGIRVMPEISARPVPLPFLADISPTLRFFLLLLAGLVLLLASMNVANVSLVRATAREREMAIRAALGSGRTRLIRQMLAENLLVSALGAAAGVAGAKIAANSFAAFFNSNTDWPVHLDFSFDWRVFSYSLAAALLTGLFVGMWPALHASRTEAGTALHDGERSNSGGRARQRLRSLLVAGQVAGSLVLLICAAYSARGLRDAQRLDLGFTPDHMLHVRMTPNWAGYDRRRAKNFFQELDSRVRSWPEVRAASYSFTLPLNPITPGRSVRIDGQPLKPGQQLPIVGCNFIDENYFSAMQIPILAGRNFRRSDSETAPQVAIINQTMAQKFWPNENPIGRRFTSGLVGSETSWEVVGVVKDGKYLLVFEPPLPFFYTPIEQDHTSQSMRVLELRTSVPPEALRARLEREIYSLDPEMPVNDLLTMGESLGGLQGFMAFRINAVQTGAMGLLGLALALVGVYGVVSYGAAQRTREIGIRMALGATPFEILLMVLKQGGKMIGFGVLAGLAGAVAGLYILSKIVVFVSVADPLTLLGVPVLLALASLTAAYIPSRRATAIHPAAALRHE